MIFKKSHTKDEMSRPEKILYYLLSITLLIDFINGIFTELPIGETYRILVLAIASFFIFKVNVRDLMYIFLMFCYVCINSLISYTDTINQFGLTFDLKMSLKAIYFIVLFKVIRSLYKANKFKLNTIKKIILNNLYYTPFLFLISYVLGIGKTSYENQSLGFKGTFMSLNSINVALLVLFIFALDGLLRNKNKLKWLFTLICITIPMILLGTKSSLIFIGFVPVLYIIINMKFKINIKLSKLVLYYWSFIFVSLALMLFIYMDVDTPESYVDQLLQRQQYLFENRDLMSYVLSGRNWLLETGSNIFFADSNFINVLFGVGYFNIHNAIAVAWQMDWNAVRPIELDFFDIFFSYGVIGILLTYGYFSFYFFKGFKNFKNKLAQPYFVTLVTLLIFSLLGGHVFLEAISSTFLGLCLAGWHISGEVIKKDL
ncbi:O-antigen ligase family protein [Bacillus wiedmannii]|uniref:O-antigen ligase family protein n=1 Tax=Bacillus wiedmannii TaxID=1890302 RepID=UPI0021CE32C3|nr:O-antigen ligase family protein [Bacillus wiedmannii]MCU5095061.1 O-antigen ligase family protein [Bacillus wiedmannii]